MESLRWFGHWKLRDSESVDAAIGGRKQSLRKTREPMPGMQLLLLLLKEPSGNYRDNNVTLHFYSLKTGPLGIERTDFHLFPVWTSTFLKITSSSEQRVDITGHLCSQEAQEDAISGLCPWRRLIMRRFFFCIIFFKRKQKNKKPNQT